MNELHRIISLELNQFNQHSDQLKLNEFKSIHLNSNRPIWQHQWRHSSNLADVAMTSNDQLTLSPTSYQEGRKGKGHKGKGHVGIR